MFDDNKEKQFILQLFNLEYSDVQDVSCIRAGNNVIIDITLASDPVPCPVCGCDQLHIKNYVTKNITHSVLSDRRCTLRYHALRYVCPVCRKTLKKWRKEIINSFHIAGYEYQIDQSTGHVAAQEKKMNNAIIENRNSIIKCIKKNANGYTNWTRFRNRVLYVLDRNSSYSMYPMKKEKKQ